MAETKVRRVSKNTLSLTVTEFVSRLLSFLLTAYLTRQLGIAAFGQYSLIINWIAIFSSFSDLGLNVLTIREVAADHSRSSYYLRNVVFLRFAFSSLFFVALFFLGLSLGYEDLIRLGLAIMGGRMVLDATMGGYVYLFQAYERMAWQGVIVTLTTLVRVAGSVVVLQLGGGIIEICWVWVVASLFAAIVLLVSGTRSGWTPRWKSWKAGDSWRVLKLSAPLAVSGSLAMMYYRIDSIMLKSLLGNEAVGLYNAAYRILDNTLIISQLFGLSLLPVLSASVGDPEAFARLAKRSFKALAYLAFPIAVGGFVLAKPIVVLVCGRAFEPAGSLFALLCLSVVPFFFANIYLNVLNVKKPVHSAVLFTILLLLNIALNLVLIPRFGASGSAVATLLSECFGLAIGFVLIRRYLQTRTSVQWGWPVTASILSALVMGAFIRLDPRLYWLVLGPVVYFLSLWLLRAVGPEDWASIRSVLKRGNA